MARKKHRKESDKALLAGIRKEMALPRVAQSAQEEAANPAAPKVAKTHA